MRNPLALAARGKGLLPAMRRSLAIAGRYGWTSRRIEGALAEMTGLLVACRAAATLPVTAEALWHTPHAACLHGPQVELAVHGLKHIDYSQLAPEKQQAHIAQARRVFQRLGLQPQGFRAPYLRWNAATLDALRLAGFCYDSSQALDWDIPSGRGTPAYQRVLEFYGAQSAGDHPSLPRDEEGLARIPYCLPDDEALVERFRLTQTEAMAEIWLDMLRRVYQAGELLTLGLHPERAGLCLGALRAVLEQAQRLTPPVWIARLDEIVAWRAALGAAQAALTPLADGYRVEIDAPVGAAALASCIYVEDPSTFWRPGTRRIDTHTFVVCCQRRPLIALSPRCDPRLEVFLRRLGYLVESASQPETAGLYFDRPVFAAGDERRLLDAIEHSPAPLVRLGRWPGAARCALAVTGDVDAFTLWDFGRRALEP